MTISASKLVSLSTCETLYYFRYVRNLRARTASPATIRGEIVHAMIEQALRAMMENRPMMSGEHAYYAAEQEAIPKIVKRESSLAFFGSLGQEFSDALNEGVAIATHFIDHVLPGLNWNVRGVEEAFMLGDMKGRLDAVVARNGVLFIVDHKTSAQDPSPTRLQMDLQTLFYAFAMQDIQRFGGPIIGTILNFMSTNVPRPPRQLKDGSLSKDKSQRTTQALYLAEVEARGLDLADYTSFIQALDDTRFNRQFELFTAPSQRAWMEHVLQTATWRMVDIELGKGNPLPCNPTTCAYCEFQCLCHKMRITNSSPKTVEDTMLYAENAAVNDEEDE